jgi:predicted dehydrogenase
VHFEQAMAALEAGSAVVIDKPFVPTVAEAKQLVARADELGLPLIVFQNRRWDGDFLTITKLLADGAFGSVHRFESTFERWGSPKPGQWQETTPIEQGGGITYDLGSHVIDQALQLFGPATVEQAEMASVRGTASEDDSFISLLHTSGVRSHLTMSKAAGQSGPRFRVLGDAGSYTVYGLDNQEPALRDGRWPGSEGYGVTPEAEWGTFGLGDAVRSVPTERGDYPAFYAGVAASIRDGSPVPVDPRDSIEVVRIIERAHDLTRMAEGSRA